MPNTPQANLRYPSLSDTPNVPTDIQELATDVDSLVIPRYATTVARDAAITSPTEGQVCYVSATGVKTLFQYSGSTWLPLRPGPYFAYKTADETIGGTTSIQNDNDLVLSLPADQSFFVKAVIAYGSPAANDFKFDFTVPSGASGNYVFDRYAGGVWIGASQVAWTTVTAVDGADLSPLYVELSGLLHIASTPGSFQLRWAQNGPAGGVVSCKQDSFLMATRVK